MARIQLYCLAVVLCFLAGLGQVQMQQFSDAQVNAAIRSPRYMRRQINCLLGETNCDTVGNQMKRKDKKKNFSTVWSRRLGHWGEVIGMLAIFLESEKPNAGTIYNL